MRKKLPKAFASHIHLKNDSMVEVSLADGQIVIKPVAVPNWTLEQLLAGVNKNNIHHEVNSGQAVGREV
jgi:antitoxin MazE